MLGKGGAGKVRMAQIDEKTKVRISKTLQKNLQKQQVYGGATTVKRQISGTASSIAFTPLQVRILIIIYREIVLFFFGNPESVWCVEVRV